jgi:hypothetical protein
MGGKGEVVINHGVAGTTVTKVYDEQALGVSATPDQDRRRLYGNRTQRLAGGR